MLFPVPGVTATRRSMPNRYQSILTCFFLVSAGLLFLSCVPPARESDTLTVVSTLFPLYDFSRQVGGEYADVSLLLPPGVEAHTYEPTPSQLKQLSEADLYIKANSGIEFEITWMDKLRAVGILEYCKEIVKEYNPADQKKRSLIQKVNMQGFRNFIKQRRKK